MIYIVSNTKNTKITQKNILTNYDMFLEQS